MKIRGEKRKKFPSLPAAASTGERKTFKKEKIVAEEKLKNTFFLSLEGLLTHNTCNYSILYSYSNIIKATDD